MGQARQQGEWNLAWRLFFGVIAAGVTYVCLVLLALGLPPAAVYGLSAAVGLAGMWFGPSVLELLGNLTAGI